MGQLVNGQWTSQRQQEDKQGRFLRPPTRFRNWITRDGKQGFTPEAGRYHLYVSYACPWAHRTLIMRALKGLEQAISLSVVDPYMGEDGWFFSEAPGCIPDTVNGTAYVRDLYLQVDPQMTGRVTVPILWDKQQQTIVNNESREIIRMLDQAFFPEDGDRNFCPQDLQERIDRTIDGIYQPINNGVYRAGFATTQRAYEEAVDELFTALDDWESVLREQDYLCGDRLTEADICLFTTLIRFDAVYYSHFKCNRRHIWDYPQLWDYVKRIYNHPGIKETCNFEHIKAHYYRSHDSINPTGIVPVGPDLSLS
ncbi:MAG: glutathione S-transferase family protein [Phormidium sp. BM_Day4_Bin.17]|nr:glutathione S-transferase family protein [Phormidium sp. BM_Day4_Bin.17]UCJ14449.1 MAG: glutathione S-transferase family protein [Phormidium sp. PBR-2020]